MHNNVYDGTNLQLPFPDAMQEFRVETSSQNAQNGYKAGGTVSLATKAGTNAFHGDAFEFFRHHEFNATSPFASINPATGERNTDGLVRNQFGGVIGGPIVQDKVFFVAAYQGTRASQTPADIVTFIPPPAMLAGDFSVVASAHCRTQGNLTMHLTSFGAGTPAGKLDSGFVLDPAKWYRFRILVDDVNNATTIRALFWAYVPAEPTGYHI